MALGKSKRRQGLSRQCFVGAGLCCSLPRDGDSATSHGPAASCRATAFEPAALATAQSPQGTAFLRYETIKKGNPRVAFSHCILGGERGIRPRPAGPRRLARRPLSKPPRRACRGSASLRHETIKKGNPRVAFFYYCPGGEGKSNHASKPAWILGFTYSKSHHTVNHTVKNFGLF